MPRTSLALAVLALLLVGCQTPSAGPLIPPVADVCPPEGLADILPPPTPPTLTAEERVRVYTAIATSIDPVRAQALVRYWEAELVTHDKIGWDRLAKIKPYCTAKVQ